MLILCVLIRRFCIFPPDGVVINDKSKVFSPDLTVTNGAIHVIDTVLMPKTQEWRPHADSFEAKLMRKMALKKFNPIV